MQASIGNNFSAMSQKPYHQQYYSVPKQTELHCSSQSYHSGEQHYSDDGSQVTNYPPQYCTLESSLAPGYNSQNSPSNISVTPTSGSPHQEYQSENYYGSPVGSSVTDDPSDLREKLREIEIAMLGPEPGLVDNYQSSYEENCSMISEQWKLWMRLSQGDLKKILVLCAKAIDEKNMEVVSWTLGQLEQMVSVCGEPLQRLGAYLKEGLVARLAYSGSTIYKALKCKEPLSSDLLSYMHILYQACPYFKFGYMSANGAIAEAVKGQDRVHIIDFQIGMGSQWMTLIQALSARPGGPPLLRITGVDDPVAEYARGGGLHIVGHRLAQVAAQFKVPLQFHPVAVSGSEVEIEHLGIQPGEALAVNFAYQLHHMPDESVSTSNPRDRLIRMVKSISPCVVTLVEQESNTNTSPFFPRFMETLDFYTAMFESIDATALARDDRERINVEQHCVARDIVNIIACEGAERIERHELLGKWRSRFTMAGFKPYPLSSVVNGTIRSLLENYNENFRLEERDGCLYLGWKNRALVASCAWS